MQMCMIYASDHLYIYIYGFLFIFVCVPKKNPFLICVKRMRHRHTLLKELCFILNFGKIKNNVLLTIPIFK